MLPARGPLRLSASSRGRAAERHTDQAIGSLSATHCDVTGSAAGWAAGCLTSAWPGAACAACCGYPHRVAAELQRVARGSERGCACTGRAGDTARGTAAPRHCHKRRSADEAVAVPMWDRVATARLTQARPGLDNYVPSRRHYATVGPRLGKPFSRPGSTALAEPHTDFQSKSQVN